MNKFEPTQAAIERYTKKAGLGQADVVVDTADNDRITLRYHRFDSDTGQRIEDEVTLVAYAEIAAMAAGITAQRDALSVQINLLNGVLAFLDGVLAEYHEPPSVEIVAPADGSNVSGTFMVRAGATDNHAVAEVLISISSIGLIGPLSMVSPGLYERALDFGQVAAGTYTLTITARDVDGNSASAAIQVVKA